MMNVGPRAAMHASIAGNISENNSPSFRMMPSPSLSPVFLNGPYPGLGASSESDCGRSRRVENNTNQADSKKLCELDLEKIASGEDTRTTLMIKNIPNKYGCFFHNTTPPPKKKKEKYLILKKKNGLVT